MVDATLGQFPFIEKSGKSFSPFFFNRLKDTNDKFRVPAIVVQASPPGKFPCARPTVIQSIQYEDGGESQFEGIKKQMTVAVCELMHYACNPNTIRAPTCDHPSKRRQANRCTDVFPASKDGNLESAWLKGWFVRERKVNVAACPTLDTCPTVVEEQEEDGEELNDL